MLVFPSINNHQYCCQYYHKAQPCNARAFFIYLLQFLSECLCTLLVNSYNRIIIVHVSAGQYLIKQNKSCKFAVPKQQMYVCNLNMGLYLVLTAYVAVGVSMQCVVS